MDFGKNAGTNTNRKISQVIKIMNDWSSQAEAKRKLVTKLDQKVTKKRENKVSYLVFQ